jgi:hypothetical protein
MQDKKHHAVEAAPDELLSGKVSTRPGYGGRPPVIGSGSYTHPLEMLLARNVISFGLYYGGLRFRADYELASITGAGTTDLQRPVTCKAPNYNKQPRDESAAHDTIVRIENMLGSIDSLIVVAVCVYGFTFGDIAKATHKAPATISNDFVAALKRVTDYYTQHIEQRSDA